VRISAKMVIPGRMLRFLPSVSELTLAGVVDIVVVACLIYQALMVVRGTRAGHILVGILIVVLLYAIAVATGLVALRSLHGFIVPYLGLAVIVLFQSEIRRTLARLGRKRWFGVGGGFRAPTSINEILLAVDHLAQQRIGALIVLERDIGLRTFIESGVPLESLLSRDLLLSIFQPGLPLHDGAVIIQKDRVAAAACFLPLTTNPALSGDLGTRHRAAIGITEETDCLSLVVSEETGRISVAAFGDIALGLSLPAVLERINVHFEVRRPAPALIDEFAADIPLAQDSATMPTEPRSSDRVNP
jgi:diadenylate cyclase